MLCFEDLSGMLDVLRGHFAHLNSETPFFSCHQTVFYCSVKLIDSSLFLIELKFDSSFTNCDVSVKSYASHLVGCFFDGLDGILNSPNSN